MLKRLRLLFGVGILFLGISCGDYAKAKEITENSSQTSALEDDKTKLFLEQNKERLDQLRKQYDQINIMIEGTGEIPYLAYKDNELCGVYPQLIELISAITKIPCTTVDAKESLEDSYNCITNREVDLILGITLPEAIANHEQNIFNMSGEGMQLHKLSGLIYKNSIILAVPQGKNYTKEQLKYAFWGTTLEYDSTVMRTMLADHTIEYNTYAQMKEAFTKNEIEGMFIPESKLNFETRIEKEAYQGMELSRVAAIEYFVDLGTSQLLSETVRQIAVLYDQLYPKYFQSEHQWMEQNSSQHSWSVRKDIQLALTIGITIIIVAVLFMIGIKKYTRIQFEKMLLKVPRHDSKWEDILFVNLRTKKIESKFGFTFYGLSSRFRKKRLPLNEMTKRIGFDFTKYYEFIISRHKTEFVHEFELYIQGVQYHYVETGIVQGKKIASRIYRK